MGCRGVTSCYVASLLRMCAQNVAVLGAGLMGAGIANVSAAKGYRVVMKDKDLKGLTRGEKQIADSFVCCSLECCCLLLLLLPSAASCPTAACCCPHCPHCPITTCCCTCSCKHTLAHQPKSSYTFPPTHCDEQEPKVKRRSKTAFERDVILSRIIGLTDQDASWPRHLKKADVVIEAVFEDMAVKHALVMPSIHPSIHRQPAQRLLAFW